MKREKCNNFTREFNDAQGEVKFPGAKRRRAVAVESALSSEYTKQGVV